MSEHPCDVVAAALISGLHAARCATGIASIVRAGRDPRVAANGAVLLHGVFDLRQLAVWLASEPRVRDALAEIRRDYITEEATG